MDDNGIIPIESSDTEEDNIPLASRRKVVTVASGSKPRRSIYPAPVVASTFTSVVGSSTSAATTSGTTSSSTKGKGKGRASIIDALDAEDLAFEKRQRDKADEKGKLAKLDEEVSQLQPKGARPSTMRGDGSEIDVLHRVAVCWTRQHGRQGLARRRLLLTCLFPLAAPPPSDPIHRRPDHHASSTLSLPQGGATGPCHLFALVERHRRRFLGEYVGAAHVEWW